MVFDEALGVNRSTVSGVQTEAHAHDFVSQLERLAPVAKARSGRILHLVDARSAAVMPQSTNETYAAYVDGGGFGVERVAVMIDSTLLKLQSQRLFGSLPMRFFRDEADAVAWLKDGGAA